MFSVEIVVPELDVDGVEKWIYGVSTEGIELSLSGVRDRTFFSCFIVNDGEGVAFVREIKVGFDSYPSIRAKPFAEFPVFVERPLSFYVPRLEFFDVGKF